MKRGSKRDGSFVQKTLSCRVLAFPFSNEHCNLHDLPYDISQEQVKPQRAFFYHWIEKLKLHSVRKVTFVVLAQKAKLAIFANPN